MLLRSGQYAVVRRLISAILTGGCAALAEEDHRPVDEIMDNSFLVEEAYNQEPGVVQHILTGTYSLNRISNADDRRFDLSFTQEWPVYGQTHQLSYTLPYSFESSANDWTEGFGDFLLNYRFQAYFNEKTLTALAPRFSLSLPTGDETSGFGNGVVGYQWNLPFSTAIGERLFFHANAGLTFLPQVSNARASDLLNYNVGGSLIYCVSGSLNLMFEWMGIWAEIPDGTGSTSGEHVSLISPGVRYALNLKRGRQLVLGLGVPLGMTRDSSEIGALFYFSFEHALFGREELSLNKGL